VEVYPGNYEDYRWRKEGGSQALSEAVAQSAARPEKVPPSNGKRVEKPEETQAKRLNPIKKKQIEERVRELEEEIGETEAAIAQCEASLQAFVSAEETQRLSKELEAARKQIQGLILEWEELSEVLEQAR
jgi:ATP-binding cassette subfamily F protein 3